MIRISNNIYHVIALKIISQLSATQITCDLLLYNNNFVNLFFRVVHSPEPDR
jgi:hypothetical protein